MAGRKYELNWQHPSGGHICLPVTDDKAVRLSKGYSRDYGHKGKLLCETCIQNGYSPDRARVKQYYICKQEHRHSIGELNHRWEKNADVVYNEQARRRFLKQQTGTTIRIEEEMEAGEILKNTLFLERGYHLHSNSEEYQTYLQKIHNYCKAKNVALLATMGYHGQMRGAVITVSNDRLVLWLLRDYRLIKDTPMAYERTPSDARHKLKAYSENEKADRMAEFLDKVANDELDLSEVETNEASSVEAEDIGFLEVKSGETETETEKEKPKAVAHQ